MAFTLSERLEKDTFLITTLTLSRLLLMNDARFPWLILVPEREDITELHQLRPIDQQKLFNEIVTVSKIFHDLTQATKMNIAMLGNQVPQLHVHIVARFVQDEAWPNPVFGQGRPLPYSTDERDNLLAKINHEIADASEKR